MAFTLHTAISVSRQRPLYLPDNYTLLLVATVVLATWLPAAGVIAQALEWLTVFAIALLFFLHGAKLSRTAIMAGIMHWRLHLAVFACTFVLFPVLGLAFRPLLEPLITAQLYLGILYLCFLPSTVQSAIALTSIAKGNVSAAVCAASGSTLLGVFLTPVMVGLWVAPTAGSVPIWESIGRILLQLMVPFVIGHLLRPWLERWMARSGKVLMVVDRGSILLVIYTAFSAAVLQGIWQQIPASAIFLLIAISIVLLGFVLGMAWLISRCLKLDKPDQITMMLAASQKSLASGVPMAQVLFATATVGIMVLPLMIYHLTQLMLCAVLAQHWGRRREDT